ncbi:hypothetical protein HanPSC8_Chr12g0510001 [Helianthus annuus]|nr:hypothetical protein HanPSC8_Chr12g0510001 [Helianthus annuus]
MIIIVILLMGDVKCGVVGCMYVWLICCLFVCCFAFSCFHFIYSALLLLYPFVSLGNIFASLGSYCFAPGWKYVVYIAGLSVLVIL